MENSDKKMGLIRSIRDRLIISGRVNSQELAEEIARRWVKL